MVNGPTYIRWGSSKIEGGSRFRLQRWKIPATDTMPFNAASIRLVASTYARGGPHPRFATSRSKRKTLTAWVSSRGDDGRKGWEVAHQDRNPMRKGSPSFTLHHRATCLLHRRCDYLPIRFFCQLKIMASVLLRVGPLSGRVQFPPGIVIGSQVRLPVPSHDDMVIGGDPAAPL